METAAAPPGNQPVKPDRLRAPAEEPGELQEVSGKYWWPLILAHFHNRNEIWRVRSNALITSYVREQDNASEARASILNILASSTWAVFLSVSLRRRTYFLSRRSGCSVSVCPRLLDESATPTFARFRPVSATPTSLSRPRPPLPARRLVFPPPPKVKTKRLKGEKKSA